jgi:hypothetical protein
MRLCAAALAAAAAPAPADAQQVSGTSGDWTFASDHSLAEASVTNADGAILGMICTDNCLNYLASERACRERGRYAGTMTSTIGAFPVPMTCRLVEGRYVLTMTPDEDFIRATAECDEISFAVQLEDGQSAVFRFSLRGAYEAISITLLAAMLNAEATAEEAALGVRLDRMSSESRGCRV